MADNLDEAKLRLNIAEIIKNGDLASLTSKKIRQILEKTYNANLMHRKKQIDDIVMQLVDEQSDDSDEEQNKSDSGKKSSKEESSEQETKSLVKSEKVSVLSISKKGKKKAKAESESDEDQSDSDESDEEAPKPKRKVKRAAARNKEKKGAKKVKTETGEVKKRAGGFSKPMLLSPELATLMGETHMARSEIVKKMWQVIRERDLLDPKNKRYTICDAELEKIIGLKRFMTFAMMKYLKKHVRDPNM